jgi:hypothetical protein
MNDSDKSQQKDTDATKVTSAGDNAPLRAENHREGEDDLKAYAPLVVEFAEGAS